MTPNLRLSDDQYCFGCGSRNEKGLRLPFTFDEKNQKIFSRWTPEKAYQGYADLLHGGITGLILDELMGNLLYKLGFPAVTAEMTVRFFKPAIVGRPIEFKAKIEKQKGRVFHLEAVAKNQEGGRIAQAHARYVRMVQK